MAQKPGTIVVGVDGSKSSARALQWAVKQAVAEHRALTLVHSAYAVTPAFTDAAIVDVAEARAALDAAGQRVLGEARATVELTGPDLEVLEVLALAHPRDVLLQLSETAAMVVVGSRGRGSVRSLLLGSVSVALVRQARCPVVVIRPGNRGTVRNGIVAGVDASAESAAVLEFAYREAALHDLPLTVLDCVWDIQAGTMGVPSVNGAPANLEEERLALAEAVAGMCERYPEVRVTTNVATGVPQEALVRLGGRMDLIVVGAHQRGRISQALFGSVSVTVVEAATCPVAVIPFAVIPVLVSR